MTLLFDHTHDLDLEGSRSEFEIALSQERSSRLSWNARDVNRPYMTMILTFVWMYLIVNRVTSDISVPLTYLVLNVVRKVFVGMLGVNVSQFWWHLMTCNPVLHIPHIFSFYWKIFALKVTHAQVMCVVKPFPQNLIWTKSNIFSSLVDLIWLPW